MKLVIDVDEEVYDQIIAAQRVYHNSIRKEELLSMIKEGVQLTSIIDDVRSEVLVSVRAEIVQRTNGISHINKDDVFDAIDNVNL